MNGVTLRMTNAFRESLFAHLFKGDMDEHGAVIAAGIARTESGEIRLLARDLFIARDGVDYIPGHRGYRMLTGEFVTRHIRYCRDQQLCYLAVHNHPGRGAVAFSDDDLASHERGYPALLDIARGLPVGALVFSENAVAGDLWLTKSTRRQLDTAVIIGPSIHRMYPSGRPPAAAADPRYDRQTRLFGDVGQQLLAELTVGVIGAGGVGSLVVEYLARLGVGRIIIVDPDRLDLTNVPRVNGSSNLDARSWLTGPGRPEWLQAFGRRIATRKVDIAARCARRANPRVDVVAIVGDFVDDSVARQFVHCDYLFLAADSFQARTVFNSMVHQYFVPGVQIGAKVNADAETGTVTDVFSVSRPVSPDNGCLLCNGLIPPARLQDEAATAAERRQQRYVEDATVRAPSVISLNARAAAVAVDDFLFSVTGLTLPGAERGYLRFTPRNRKVWIDEPRADYDCIMCGLNEDSRRARGDSRRLPTRPSG